MIACVVVAPARAQAPVVLMPNVTYEQDVEFTPDGPVAVDVITVPRPGGLYELTSTLAGGTIGGTLERLTQLETDAAATATVAGISGDYFDARTGYPAGLYMQDQVLAHAGVFGRSSVGIDSSGGLHVARVTFTGYWRGAGQRRPLNGVNQVPNDGQVVLFTPAWGQSTPLVANSAEVVLEPFPSVVPDTELAGTVSAATTGGGTPIPADGAVLMAVGSPGSGLPSFQADAPVGSSVTARVIMPSDWSNVVTAIGGGPVLVRASKPVFQANENFSSQLLTDRSARAGIGQLADGRIILVAVDGNQPGFSIGMSAYELAKTMAQLGAVTAVALVSGGPVTAAFDGQLLNRPGSGGQPLKDALLLKYYGVYAPPPTLPLVAKQGAGVVELLTYKLVRPSTVTAAVIAPDGVSHVLDSGSRQPGNYSFKWTAFDTEGTWHWDIKAVDDLGRQSIADQPFQYDLTLSNLVPSTTKTQPSLTVGFALARPAVVILRIETGRGVVVATAPGVQLPTGSNQLRWDGTLDGTTKAPPGSYTARVTAVSAIGTTELTCRFMLR